MEIAAFPAFNRQGTALSAIPCKSMQIDFPDTTGLPCMPTVGHCDSGSFSKMIEGGTVRLFILSANGVRMGQAQRCDHRCINQRTPAGRGPHGEQADSPDHHGTTGHAAGEKIL